MDIELLGQRQLQAHQHGRPNRRVKPDNVLADDLYLRWPELLEVVFFRIAQHGYIVHQGLEPDIHDLVRIAGYRNAPADLVFGPRDADVVQAALEKAHDFVAPGFRHDQELAAIDGLDDLVAVFVEFEEIVFLFDFFVRPIMGRADAVVGFDFGISDESLVAGTIPADVFTLVNVLFELLPDQLRALFMSRISRANETVIADVQQLAQLPETLADLVGEGLGLQSLLGGLFGNLAAMLVSAGAEDNLITLLPRPARQDVSIKQLHSETNMRIAVDIGNRRRDVVLAH